MEAGKASWTLRRLAFCSALIYALNALHYALRPFGRTWLDDGLAWGAAIPLAVMYWRGYRLLSNGQLQPRTGEVVRLALPLLAIAFLTLPYDSTDIVQYIAMGWAQSHYELNPYSNVLRDIPGVLNDPMMGAPWMGTNVNPWLDLPFVYGFAFAVLAKGLAWAGNGGWWATLALFKLVNVFAYAGIAACLWALTRGVHAPDRPTALYLFMWSPLILLHHIGNGHNDLLVGVLLVFALLLIARQRGVWALAALAAATLVKYATAPVMIFVWIYLWKKQGKRAALAGIVLSAGVAAALAFPYADRIGEFRFDLMESQLNKITAGSLYSFFFYSYRSITRVSSFLPPLEQFGTALKVVLWLSAGCWMAVRLVRFIRNKTVGLEDLIYASAETLVIVILASSQFYSWYIGMFFPLAILLRPESRLRQFSVLMAATHITSLTSLRGKGIGYFMATTGLAGIMTMKRDRAKRQESYPDRYKS